MHNPITYKFSIFKSWNHLEDALLFSPFKVSLETNDIIETTSRIVLTKLNNRIRCLEITVTWPFVILRILQTNRFHRAIEHCLDTTFSHDLDRHTPFEILFFFKGIQRSLFSCCQGLMEGHELFLGHWTV